MKILVKRREENGPYGCEYDLSIESGHFTGTLGHVSEVALEKLRDSICDLLDNRNQTGTLVWNPRSGRHELVK